MDGMSRSDWRLPGLIPLAGRHVLMAAVLSLSAGLLPSLPAAIADEEKDETSGATAVVPLRSLLDRVTETFPGHILEVELEREDHGGKAPWIYEVKLLTDRGRVLKLEYDASTLELLKMKGRAER